MAVLDNPSMNELLHEIEQQQASRRRVPAGFQFTQQGLPTRETIDSSDEVKPPTRLPHQPKGRVLTTLVFLSVLGAGGFWVWNSLFRYDAFGVVTANVVEVSALNEGVVASMQVREGDDVRQGQLVMILESLKARHDVERLGDELRLARANLTGEIARLNWQLQIQQLERGKASAEFFEAAARLKQEEALQEKVENRLDRAKSLHLRNTLSDDQFEQVLFDHQGQTRKVEQLRDAVNAWKDRSNAAESSGEISMDHVEPLIAKIELLKGELRRARELVRQGEVRSPMNGRVERWHVRIGEHAPASSKLFSLVEEGSARVKLYLRQQSSNRFVVGDNVTLGIKTVAEDVACQVDRIGMDLESAPDQIARYYAPGEKLNPVELSLKQSTIDRIGVPTGALVRLESNWCQKN